MAALVMAQLGLRLRAALAGDPSLRLKGGSVQDDTGE